MRAIEKVKKVLRDHLENEVFELEKLLFAKAEKNPKYRYQNYFAERFRKVRLMLQERPYEEVGWMDVMEWCRRAQGLSNDRWHLEKEEAP